MEQNATKAKGLIRCCDTFGVDCINGKNIYENKFKKQLEVKIAEFQYKVLQDIIPTGYNLFRWKKIDLQICIYCNSEVHDCKHLLFECKHIKTIWDIFKAVTKHDISWKDIILGIDGDTCMNCVISLISYIIYKKYIKDREQKHVRTSITYYVKS